MAVFASAPPNVAQGAARRQLLPSAPVLETQLRAFWAEAGVARTMQATASAADQSFRFCMGNLSNLNLGTQPERQTTGNRHFLRGFPAVNWICGCGVARGTGYGTMYPETSIARK